MHQPASIEEDPLIVQRIIDVWAIDQASEPGRRRDPAVAGSGPEEWLNAKRVHNEKNIIPLRVSQCYCPRATDSLQPGEAPDAEGLADLVDEE